jgi:hypothetical protein
LKAKAGGGLEQVVASCFSVRDSVSPKTQFIRMDAAAKIQNWLADD